MAFNPPLSKIMDDVEKDVDEQNEKTFRGNALQLFSLIVQETPVDKGTARGGWQASVGSPDYSESGKGAQNTIRKLPKNPKLLNFYLSNPIPYIEVLEFGGYGDGPKTVGGYSKLAPRGMIRVNMRRLKFI